MMDRTMFEPQLEAVEDDYHLLAYDSRARTDNWQGPYGLDALAADCKTLLDAYGVEDCVVVGMSVGGFMALRFALTYPDYLDGFVLADAPAGPQTPNERENYRDIISHLRDVEHPPESLARQIAERVTSDTTQCENPELIGHWVKRWQTRCAPAIATEYESMISRSSNAGGSDLALLMKRLLNDITAVVMGPNDFPRRRCATARIGPTRKIDY